MERKFCVKDSNLLYDSSLVSQINSQVKAPIFSRFTWTQSLHALHKPLVSDDVEGILNAFSEDRKRYERMKQIRFTLAETQEPPTVLPKTKSQPLMPPFRKPPQLKLADTTEDEEAEDQTKAKKGQRTSLVSRVTTGLDKLEALILTSRSNEGENAKEQLADIARNSQKRRLFQAEGWQKRYDDLFGERELYSEKTADLDRAFVTRIEEIQKQLSPDFQGKQQSTEETMRKRLGSSQMRVLSMQKKQPDIKTSVRERYVKIREKEKVAALAAVEAALERSPRLTHRSGMDRTSFGTLKSKRRT